METQYIFIRKNKSEAKSVRIQSEVKTVLKDASFDVDNNVIYLSENHQEKYLTYRMSVEDNNTLYFSIETQLRGEVAAKLLDEFNERLVNGYHKRKFYIINAYSDSAHWYCSKLMPKIGTFERLLREFIYLTVTDVYGSEWIKYLNPDKKKQLEGRSNGKLKKKEELIQTSLEWLEFNEISDLLFTPCVYADVDVDAIIREILNNDSLTREDILEKIKLIEKVSLWDRDLQSFSDLKDLQNIFSEIRDIRNTVMHNKTINLQYFEEAMSKIKGINKQLLTAIEKIDKDIYDAPKGRKTLFVDGKVFAEAIWKIMQKQEDQQRSAELGKRLTDKLMMTYGNTQVSTLINQQSRLNAIMAKKVK